MGTRRYAAFGCGVLLSFALLHGEQITTESNTFTFPEMVPVKTLRSMVQNPFFKSSAITPITRTVSFSWWLPGSSEKQAGSIIIYSLLGRVVGELPVGTTRGTATWNFRASHCKSGIYLARISIGSQVKNLKLMLWN